MRQYNINNKGENNMINKRMKLQFENYIEGKEINEGLVYQFLKEYYTSPKINSLYMYASNMRAILKDMGINIEVKASRVLSECMEDTVSIMKYDELIYITESLINKRDSVICYLSWLNWSYDEITTLKRDNYKSKMEGDAYGTYLCELAYEETEYVLASPSVFCSEGFVYNENNPYLLRPKPSITNDFGINKMTEFAIKTLFQKLSNTYNKKINHRDLRISGILFAYDNYLKTNELEFSVKTLEQFLNDTNRKGGISSLYKHYKDNYVEV